MRSCLTSIFLLVLLLHLSTLSVEAQNISVASFKSLPNDLDARVNFPMKDQNGDVCAIIKVVTTQTGFSFDSGQIGIFKTEQKSAEIWLYVPYGTKRLTISHPYLGTLRDYQIPLAIAKATVYELVLVSGKVKTIVEEGLLTIWLTIRSNPDGADIYINDVLKGITPLPVKLTPGKYSYRIEKSLYHSGAGLLQITGREKDGKKDLLADLKPAYGTIKISTQPEQGATVLIDDLVTGNNTPFTGERIKSGLHKITVKKELFQPKSIEITVRDGEISEETMTLNPNFANVTVLAEPNADIYIDGIYKAKNRFQGRIPTGVSTFEAKKGSYYPDKRDKEIAAGEELTINLTVRPILGNIEILSNPIDARIFLNNEEKGTTPITLQKLLVGNYELKLEKKGYKTIIKTIAIAEDKTTEVNEKLLNTKAETINPSTSEKGPGISKSATNFSSDYYKYKKRKTIWLASTVASAAAGTFFYLQSSKTYDEYQTATDNAVTLQDKVELYNTIYPACFGVAGISAITFVLNSIKQNKSKGQKISFYTQPLPYGAGFGLAYKF